MLSKDSDSINIGNEPELARLAEHLEATAPFCVVDPVFREALRNKLRDSLTKQEATETVGIVPDNLLLEPLLISLVHEIADFPDGERIALLIGLANRMQFGPQLTPLQRAFLEKGIHLQDYRWLLSSGLIDSEKYTYFLNLAYEKIAKLQKALEGWST